MATFAKRNSSDGNKPENNIYDNIFIAFCLL
jgi:hypothetical protein